MPKTPIGFCLAMTAILTTWGARGDDWPEWRGEGRLGVWNETGLLERFPSDGLKVKWRVPVGAGYGGPAVAAGRVFVTDWRRTEGSDGIERVLALDEESGKTLWEHEWSISTRGLQPVYANGPRATPTVDGDRVYVLGSTGKLFCLRSADGGVVWSRDYVADFAAEVPPWGMVGAPLVDGERLLLLVGGEPDALAMALDKNTGKEVWRALPTVTQPGYAPPFMVTAGDAQQLIIWSPEAIRSLEPASGRVNWEFPYKVDMGQTISTPIVDGNRLLVSSASHGSTMMLLDKKEPTARIVWQGKSTSKADVEGIHAFLSTPFLDGDYVYGVGGIGHLRCLDAATGKEIWKTTEPAEDARIANAFLVKNGDRYFISNDRGELILARLSPTGYDEIDRTELIEPTNSNGLRARRERGAVNWVHPAYANGHIVIRNDNEIVRASLLAK